MKKCLFLYLLIAFLVTVYVIPAVADLMSSANYSITSSVVSGSGGLMESANFDANSTVGQQSPLANPTDPSFSNSYDLYPGFWYTIAYYEVPKRSKSLPLILLLLNE